SADGTEPQSAAGVGIEVLGQADTVVLNFDNQLRPSAPAAHSHMTVNPGGMGIFHGVGYQLAHDQSDGQRLRRSGKASCVEVEFEVYASVDWQSVADDARKLVQVVAEMNTFACHVGSSKAPVRPGDGFYLGTEAIENEANFGRGHRFGLLLQPV